jgi:hypothetical protein
MCNGPFRPRSIHKLRFPHLNWFRTGLGSRLVLVQDWSWFKTGPGSRLVEGTYQLEWEIALKSHQSLNLKYLESSMEKNRKSGIRTFENFRTTGTGRDVQLSPRAHHAKTGKNR